MDHTTFIANLTILLSKVRHERSLLRDGNFKCVLYEALINTIRAKLLAPPSDDCYYPEIVWSLNRCFEGLCESV